MASNFRTVIGFFDNIGLFDVLLPFLMVFTMVYALLEKTKIFGVERVDSVEYTRKNLNAMAAFCIAFFVVASSQLVEIVTKVSSNMVILLLASVFFLLLAGSFHQDTKNGYFLEKGKLRNLFMGIMFVGLVVIFLDAMKTGDQTWLQIVFSQLSNFGSSEVVPSIVLVIIMVGIIAYIVSDQHPVKKDDSSGTSNHNH